MPAGRPTLYSPELVAKANEYVSGAWRDNGDAYPQISSLASYLGITRKTVWEWCKEESKAEFCDIIDELMQRQESELFNKAMVGDFNSTMAKLALTKHGYTDKTENTHQGGDKPLTFIPWEVAGVAPT
jgi:hypothetical protein